MTDQIRSYLKKVFWPNFCVGPLLQLFGILQYTWGWKFGPALNLNHIPFFEMASRNKKGFTLVEVIAVLVILGILASVATARYLDVQEEARKKSFAGCIAVLNGEVKLAFANNILTDGPDGRYDGYRGNGDPDFVVTNQSPNLPASGTIKNKNHPDTYNLIWTPGPSAGPENKKKPGHFTLGSKI